MVIGTLLVQSVSPIALGVGILLAALRWNRHPQVSKWAIIGFGGMLFNGILVARCRPSSSQA